jgi:hypothetical protein
MVKSHSKNTLESDISARIQLRASEMGARLWRNQSGKYQLADGRWLSSGLFPGSPDLIGVLPNGRFLAVEVKRPGQKPRPNQISAIEFLISMNCCAGICTSVQDFEELVACHLSA